MAYYITSFGTSAYKVSTSGSRTALTLPTNVTLDTTRIARMAVLGRQVVIVNQPNRGLMVDADANVYFQCPAPPTSAPVLSAGAAGSLSGTFRAKYSFAIKDGNGTILAESPLSPASAQQTISSQMLTAKFEISRDSGITHRRLYRTVTNGATYFPWFDVEGNTLTQSSDDLSDALLDDIAAPTELGAPPGTMAGTYLTLIAEWKGRLWGVGNIDVDTLLFSAAGSVYGWPADYNLPISPIGADEYGITGIIRRRDELGICKRNIIWKVVGEDPDSFEPIMVVEGKGVYGPDTIRVIRDVGYFLGEDGVYAWGPDGVKSISDDKVRAWFATDTYFNRSKFPNAFAKYNSRYHSYELHLAAAGSSNIDRWVSYDISSGVWFGPHKTDAFTPTFAGEIVDANGLSYPVILASDGFIYRQNESTFADAGTAIAFSAVSKAHAGDTPDITKLFKEMAVINKVETTDGAMTVAAAVGDISKGALNPGFTKTFYPELRDARQRFDIIGPGRAVQLTFAEATLNQGCSIHGYEIPFHELGRR
jgi:hypothetical protein